MPMLARTGYHFAAVLPLAGPRAGQGLPPGHVDHRAGAGQPDRVRRQHAPGHPGQRERPGGRRARRRAGDLPDRLPDLRPAALGDHRVDHHRPAAHPGPDVHAGRVREAGTTSPGPPGSCILLVAPIAVALFVLAGPVASLLFGYGAADPEQISQLGTVTRVFALAIMPFTTYYILLRGLVLHGGHAHAVLPRDRAEHHQRHRVDRPVLQRLPGAPRSTRWRSGSWSPTGCILLMGWPILSRRFGGLDTRRTVLVFGKVFAASLVGLAAALLCLPADRVRGRGVEIRGPDRCRLREPGRARHLRRWRSRCCGSARAGTCTTWWPDGSSSEADRHVAHRSQARAERPAAPILFP